jgi:hypothetical protein
MSVLALLIPVAGEGKSGAEYVSNASCNEDVESVLDAAFRYATPLSSEDSPPGLMSGDEVRTNRFYLLPDIATNYSDAGCWTKATKILAQSRGMLRDQLIADLTASLIKKGFADKAEELLRTLDPPGKQNDLLVKLAVLNVQLKNDEKANTLIREVEDRTPDKFQGDATAEFIRTLVKNGFIDIAEKYAIADESNYRTASLLEVASGCIKQKQLSKGEALIAKALRDCEVSDGSCDTALWLTARAYYSGGKADAAVKYAQKIPSINTRTQNPLFRHPLGVSTEEQS